jgi:hypothetical protein
MYQLLRTLFPLVAVFGLVATSTSQLESQVHQPDGFDDFSDDLARSVLTQHNDSMRTGTYLVEQQLTPTAVDSATGPGMALRYWRKTDGNLWAQLLYARVPVRPGLGPLEVIFAFTQKNTVYAFNANEERDPGTTRGLVWSRTLPATPHPALNEPLGIIGTPVIDPSRGTLFVVYGISNGKKTTDPEYEAEFHLAALKILGVGRGKVLRDVVVTGSAPSSVDPFHVDFVASRQLQRAGLLLAPNPKEPRQRTVYVAFAARWPEETINYHGWVMGYDAETFVPRGVFCTACTRACPRA